MPDNNVVPLGVVPLDVFDNFTKAINQAYSSSIVLQGLVLDTFDHCVRVHDQRLRILINRYRQGVQFGIYPSIKNDKAWWVAVCSNRDDLPRFFEDQRHNLPRALAAEHMNVQACLESPSMLLLVRAQLYLYRSWFGEVPGISNPFQPAVREASITPINARRPCE